MIRRDPKVYQAESPDDSARHPFYSGWALLGHAVGAGLLAVVVVVCAAEGATADATRVASLYATGSIAVLVGAILSPRLGALYLIVAYYFAIFTGVPALVQIQRRQFPFGSAYNSAELNDGFLVLALGQLSLLVGVALVGLRRRHTATVTNRSLIPTSAETSVALRLALLFAAIGIVLAVAAGPAEVFAARFDESGEASGAETLNTQLALVARSFTLVALLLSLIAHRRRSNQHGRAATASIIAFTALAAATVNFPPALPRFQLLGVGLAISVLLINFRRPIVKIIFSTGATFFVLYLFASIKDLRDGISLDKALQTDIGAYLLTADFDGYKQIVDTVIYFSSAERRWGENFLGALFFWVPRSLWPSKPVHTGQVVSEGLGYPYNNVANPLPAEAYASWGIAGVIVVMAAIGTFIGILEGRGSRGIRAEPSIAIWLSYALATGYATILLRGALNAVAPMILSAFVLSAVVAIRCRSLERRRTPRSRASARRRND